MKYFICSMANDGHKNIVELLTDRVGQLEKFAEDHDQPRRAVYACVNPLKDSATRRGKDEVAEIVTLHVDIDFKRLATPPDEVRRKILELPLPVEVRESGGGLHVKANLKEPYENGTDHFRRAEELRTQLTALLCGDPAPNHSAALLRVVGTHNSKYGDPIKVSVVRAGEPVDLTDVEAFLDLYPHPLFEVNEEYTAPDSTVDADTPFVPIDTDAVLADMPTTSEGVNAVQPRLLRALIVREGMTADEAVDTVVDATMAMAQREGLHSKDTGELWTREAEQLAVHKRMKSVLGRLQLQHWAAVDAGQAPEGAIPNWLWPKARDAWIEACRDGVRPHLFRNGAGWCVRRPPHSGNGKAAAEDMPKEGTPRAETPKADAGKRSKYPPLEFLAPFNIAAIPPREWYLGKQYQRGSVSGTMAPGGRGKSSLALVEAISMATGRKLLHHAPLRQLKVWYHNGEEPWEEMLRRAGAVLQQYGIKEEALQDQLCMTTPQTFPLRVAEGYDKCVPDAALLVHMKAEIERNGFDVVILDPLITLHGVQESNPVLMRGVMDIFRDIAAELDRSIEVVGHTRKPQAGVEADLSVHDARGASSITDALRSVRVLDVMTESECDKAGLEEHERPDHVRISPAKRNYSRTGAPPEWIKLESVLLPNGDDVGVVTPWTWPTRSPEAAAEVAKLADGIFIEVAVRLIAMGRRLSDRKGQNFAPKIIAREKEARSAKVGAHALEAAMRRLIEQNRVRVVDSCGGGRFVHELEVV